MPGQLVSFFALLATAALVGQDPVAPVPPKEPAYAVVMKRWIRSAHDDRKLLDECAAALLDAGEPGLRALHLELTTLKAEDRDRRIAIETLLSTTVLASLEREANRGMRFAGQFDHLRTLQPYAGNFLLNLMLQTPSWFPSDQRVLVVPPLRDVFQKPPEASTLHRLEEMAKDEDFESEELREALSLALAQWGRRDLVKKRLDTYTENAGDGKTADELHFVRALAKLEYELREYPEAAAWWERFITGTVALGDRVAAIDEYDAACSYSLAARGDDALAALERCAALVADGKVDSSAVITREMFENDPDLRAVRGHERFAAAMTKAFGEKAGEARR